jgi:FtsH-binding integral membrane protein
MKLYILIMGLVFALLFLAHVARVVLEGWQVASPVFVITTLASLAMCLWAISRYRQQQPKPPEE